MFALLLQNSAFSELGKSVPVSLKAFLLALAIIDNLVAIIVIALFYTTELSTTSTIIASVSLAILFILNRAGIAVNAPYILIGIVL